MKLRRILALVLCLCLLAGLTACGSTATDNKTEPAQSASGGDSAGTASGGDSAAPAAPGKTQLNVATELTSTSYDPALDYNSCWFAMRFGMLEALFLFADDGTAQPWLAESGTVADDGLTWTIKLKDGICFSTGEPVTATKVKESLENLYARHDPANGGPGYAQTYFTYSSITADDAAATVTIVTEKPTVDLLGALAYPWSGIYDVKGSEGRNLDTEGGICTGPYVMVSNDPEHDIQLARNEHYWNGEVPFETVNIMKLSEASTRAMALQDGSADMAINISSADRVVLAQDASNLVDVTSGSRMGSLYINFQGTLANDTLRKAVYMSIDGEAVADITTGGSYSYSNGAPLPVAYQNGLDFKYGFDPEGAAKLLDDAGIVDSNGDGIRELDGKNVELNFISQTNRQQDLIAQAYATQIEAIGIKVNLTFPDNLGEIRSAGNYDLCTNNEVTTPTGDPASYLLHWYGKNEASNWGRYSNPEFDALYEKLSGEFDTAKRMQLFKEIQQVMMDDVASIVYGAYSFNICANANVTGVHSYAADFYWVTKDITPAA